MIIYAATSPSGKKYIGLTKHSMQRRKSAHLRLARNGDTRPFYQAIRKYDKLITWEILETTDSFEEACRLEIFYIEKYNSTQLGYNISTGGQGTNGVSCPEWKKKLHKEQMTGLIRSEINKINCSLGKSGKMFNAYDKSGNIVGTWQNLRQCGRDLNIPKPLIWRCLKGLRNSTRDLIFRYTEV